MLNYRRCYDLGLLINGELFMSNSKNSLKYVYFGISFGTTMAVSIYFGFKGGAWLDNYFGTKSVFMLLGVLLGILASFKSLLTNLKRLDKNKN